MLRELFHIGSFSISPFGVMLMLAFLAAYAQLSWGLKRLGAGDEEDASAILFAGGIGGIVGAKVYYAILYHDWHLLFDRSGLVWYGGFIVGGLAVIWVLRHRHLPAWRTADAAASALALGYAIGRIGCFLVGDDYGIPTHLPWGVKFPVGLPPTTAENMRTVWGINVPASIPGDQLIAVHPTQVYETLICLGIWLVGRKLIRRHLQPGTAGLWIFALLAVERFGVEFLRAKDDRFFGSFTLAQVISVAVLILIFWIWAARSHIRRGRHDRGSPSEG